MSYSYECPHCGARLDPGEKCDCNKKDERMEDMSKLIFCKFLDAEGKPRGRDYTYKTDIDIQEGDRVLVTVNGSSDEPKQRTVIVTKIGITPEDIPGYETFKDRIVTIDGIAPIEEATPSDEPEELTKAEVLPVDNAEALKASALETEIVSVIQLPIIRERLQVVRDKVTERVNQLLSLSCTDETVKEVKSARALLNREFEQWEQKRKEVKNLIMAPYENFNSAYRECISDIYKTADASLKEKINAVEDGLRDGKVAEVRAYFDELCRAKNIDFVTFERTGIKITLSSSMKSLKEKAKACVDRICNDLALIDTQEYKDEILYEYKRSLDVSASVIDVTERHRAIEDERIKSAETLELEDRQKEAEAKVDKCLEEEPLHAPDVTNSGEACIEEPKTLYTLTFKAQHSSLTAFKKLKEFLEKEGFTYEQL